MTTDYGIGGPERMVAALGSGAITLLIGWALLGFGIVAPPVAVHDAITAFAVRAEPVPAPVEPATRPAPPREAGAAAPANRHATPRAVPAAPAPVPTPLQAPPVTATGAQNSAGASELAGPGTGAGGQGLGRGAGGSGDGTGGGGGGGGPRWRVGAIRNADYPDAASRANIGGTVEARLTITAEGRVSDCQVTRSSGRRDLDETTCRLILRRFRFHPARNAAGEAIASSYGWRQRWWLEGARDAAADPAAAAAPSPSGP